MNKSNLKHSKWFFDWHDNAQHGLKSAYWLTPHNKTAEYFKFYADRWSHLIEEKSSDGLYIQLQHGKRLYFRSLNMEKHLLPQNILNISRPL